MTELDQDALTQNLKKRRVCRFCLSVELTKLTNIYTRDTRIKSSAPLPIQIMAIASIEVFSNDGMPSFVCSDCTEIFEYSYQFKQMCKKADNLLRQYPLTGKWPKALEKPVLLRQSMAQTPAAAAQPAPKPTRLPTQQNSKPQESLLQKKIILNAAPSSAPVRTQTVRAKIEKPDEDNNSFTSSNNNELPLDEIQKKKIILNTAPSSDPVRAQPVRAKIERHDEDSNMSSFLSKIENNDELSLDDIHQLVAAEDVAETEFVDMDQLLPVVVVDSGNKTKPKLLNKSSVRILNKDVNIEKEPRLSFPKIKKGQDGNMEIVAEILDYDAPFENEPDPKNAEVIDTNVFPCPHCERSFPLVQLRDIHIKNHNRDRHFQCDECDKRFFSKYDLQRHTFTHNGAKPFKCTACDRAFSRASLLQRHEKSHTDVPKYICVTCERPFISKEAMEKHAERHKINRPFQCKMCNKGFAFKQGLERHEVIHSREQPHPCQYCDQSFSTTAKLARHLTAHAGERPFPCKFCTKSYLLSHHLTRHMRSHKSAGGNVAEVSFLCSRCSESFESRDELIRHSTTHADEENLSCPLCKESFDSIDKLTRHIRDHSDGDAFACEFCDLIFITGAKLQVHIDKDHAQEMEAYHEDDRLQAERIKKNKQNDSELSEESLQTTVDEIMHDGDDPLAKGNMKQTIKKERGSPKIISQIVVSPSHNEGDQSLLIPLKQIKREGADKKIIAQSTVSLKAPQSSPQLRRKVATPAAANQPVRDKNQPSIQSMLKLPKGITLTKTPKQMKSDEETSPKTRTQASVSPKGGQNVVKMKIGDKNVKVQKIRVTKAEAAAMAKEGRIKIKDGQIILTQDHK